MSAALEPGPELGEALFDELAGGHARVLLNPQPGDVGTIAGFFGRSPRTQNPAMAAALAGTPDSRSREYRAAIRNLQRWRKVGGETRRPGPRSLAALARVARMGRTAPYRRFGTRATITGLVQVSKDLRRRTLRAIIPPEDSAPFLDAFEALDLVRLEGTFLVAFRRNYGGVFFEIVELEAVTLTPDRPPGP